MPQTPIPVHVSSEKREQLQALVRRTSTPHAIVVRAKIILSRSDGESPTEVAKKLDCHANNVTKWCKRWRDQPYVEALSDRCRSGRPLKIALETRCEAVAIACDREGDSKAPLEEVMTLDEIAEKVLARTGCEISRSSLHRVLHANGLRPHRIRYWMHSTDPEFQQKTKRICELYRNLPKDGIVLCIDEKPMQALSRRHPTHRTHDGSIRYEFEYIRHGTCTLLAAFDVRTGKVIGKVVAHRDAKTLEAFMETVAVQYPGKRIFVVWDNLSTHIDGPLKRWKAFNERHEHRFEFVYTPKHASWLNQVEIWFSILQRRVLRIGNFPSVEALDAAVLCFIDHWNKYEAHPFRWKFSGEFTPREKNRGLRIRRSATFGHRRAMVAKTRQTWASSSSQTGAIAHS